ncbi:MAG TPA: hypothetical protein VG323_12695 [Thermoanaerobaculia bacterium]|nr:hypothetical protein [Thermoanaerobaculia bacterium]
MNRCISLIAVTLLLALASATVVCAQQGPYGITGDWEGYATLSLSPSNTVLTTATSIDFLPSRTCADIGVSDCYWRLEGNHSIDTGYMQPIYVIGLSYHGSFQAPADPGTCATASSYGFATVVVAGTPYPVSSGGPWNSPQVCVPVPPPPKCTLSVSAGGGGSLSSNPSGTYDCGSTMTITAAPAAGYEFVSWGGDITSYDATITFILNCDMTLYANFQPVSPPPEDPPSQCSADWVSGCSPIVINFAKGNYQLTGKESPVLFDIAASGTPVRIGWTTAGADEAFLCRDRDHDGRITSGAELFGNATPLRNGAPAQNGFLALAEYDDNHDGVIDERDRIWGELLLWRDLNHDGISQPSELAPVVGSGLAAISLDYYWTGRRDSSENLFKYESRIWMTNSGGQATPRPVYDIFFVRVP